MSGDRAVGFGVVNSSWGYPQTQLLDKMRASTLAVPTGKYVSWGSGSSMVMRVCVALITACESDIVVEVRHDAGQTYDWIVCKELFAQS